MAETTRRLAAGMAAALLLSWAAALAFALAGAPLASFVDPAASGYWPLTWLPAVLGALAWWVVALGAAGLGGFVGWAAIDTRAPANRWYRLPLERRDDPRLRIAQRASDALVCYVAERVEGVRRCRAEVALTDRGWDVQARIHITHDAAPAQVIDALKLRIGATLRDHTGQPLARLSVDPARERVA